MRRVRSVEPGRCAVTDTIMWSGAVGVSEASDILTRRAIWWVKLDNGQTARVVDARVFIIPSTFPGRQSHYSGHNLWLNRSGLRTEAEKTAYADALASAFRWFADTVLHLHHGYSGPIPRPTP